MIFMIDKRVMTGVIILILLLISVMGLVIADTVLDGKRVNIEGTVSNNIVTGWSISVNRCLVQQDSLFNIAFFYMPWETKDILVIATITETSTGKAYTGESWIGTANVVYSNKPYTVHISFVDPGNYNGIVVLYEVDKGFWGVFEEDRVECARSTFEVIV